MLFVKKVQLLSHYVSSDLVTQLILIKTIASQMQVYCIQSINNGKYNLYLTYKG